MLEKITRYLSGYAEFEITGNTSRFINIASKSGIMLWGYKKNNDSLTAYIKADKYKKLRAIKKRTGVKMHCIKKTGIPFYLWKGRKRKGIFIGAVVFVAIYYFLSGSVWDIQVSGNDLLTENQILEAARSIGIYEGARKSSFKPADAAISMHRKIKALSWLSINTEGNTVTIEVEEVKEGSEIYSDDSPCDIIANREGQIKAINAENGMRLVDIGDTVHPGQILIAGSYNERETPYLEKKAPKKSYLVAARGSVIAETVREFRVEIPIIKAVEEIDRTEKNKYFIFFGIKIPIGINSNPKGTYHSFKEKNMLTLLDQKLPVGFLKEEYQHYYFKEKILSQQEWEQEALYKLREEQTLELTENCKIINEELNFDYGDNICILTSYCIVQEEIGEKRDIIFDNPNIQ